MDSKLAEFIRKLYGIVESGAEAYGSANRPMSPEHSGMLGGALLDMTPGVGDVKSAYDGVQAAKQGDYLGAGLGALGALPFIPNMAGGVKFYRGTAGKGHDFSDPNRLGGIFFTTDKEYAQKMAERSARKYGGEPRVDLFDVDYGRLAPPGMSIQKAKERGFDSAFAGNELIIWDAGRIKNKEP